MDGWSHKTLQGTHSRKALCRLNSTYCDHSILFLAGLRPFLNRQHLQNMWVLYFLYCKNLLYLPLSYRNWKIIRKFCATDIIFVYKKLYARLGTDACQRLGPYHPLTRLYWLYCLFCIFVLSDDGRSECN